MAADSGNGEARVVRNVLRDLGFEDVYDVPVASWLCWEPVIVTCADWERASLQADLNQRGRRQLTIHVCRDLPNDAEANARSIAAALLDYHWASLTTENGLPADLRIVHGDVGQPALHGRDRSGQTIWDVPLTLTVVIATNA